MKLSDLEHSSFEPNLRSLKRTEAEELMREVPQWTLKDEAIEREFQLKDFRKAMEFVNQVADIAEKQDHHPDILIRYNKVTLTLSTHKVRGLSPKDFILATKIDLMMRQADNSFKGAK